ncbi:MAG TPA: AAA family ATPase, partial [Candidatus Limnocylindrales bacterium]
MTAPDRRPTDELRPAGPTDPRRELIDDLDALLSSLPPEIVDAVHALPDVVDVIEVVLDLGRRPEARFPDGEVTLLEREVGQPDIDHVVEHIGTFGDDNRAGIERTLHRISAIRNRNGKIVGLTCRIGRAVYGTIEIIEDFVETGKSVLIMGRPGIGKTTMLREAARVLADDLGKRVVVVDTSNEIAGDGDIPHPAIGKARRMQVRTPSMQHEVMIEAVENHMPQVIVIDEIGTELEAQAARTIAERGVQLIGTAHGNNLDNLMLNPTLSDLIGGIQSVTLGDEEARRRRTQKSVLERKAPPTFDCIIEIQDRDRVLVHTDVAETVDALLRGDPVAPELRWRDEEGVHRSQSRPRPSPREQLGGERFAGLVGAGSSWRMEPGWRGDSSYRTALGERGFRPGYRPGGGGSWRPSRSTGAAREGERTPGASTGTGPAATAVDDPFVAGEIADRGPLERPDSSSATETRARESRERQRQQAWREQATRALDAFKAEEGTGPANAAELAEDDERLSDMIRQASVEEDGETLRIEEGATLPTLRVFPFGVSRKRLEQAVREL